MNPSAPPIFKFAREAYSVRVENIAECASRYEIVGLFNNLVGEVRNCEERVDEMRGRQLQLTFHTRDACKKALCMSGYTVAGVPLAVTSMRPLDSCRPLNQSKQADIRRNLYVLGLPFDLTKTEFNAIFSRHGTVSHSVILATVDNASRRRGFVVMSNHAEARAALNALSRSEIKGYRIDVSWAVVQRSQGFLDGGDRAMMLTSRPSSASSMEDSVGSACDSCFTSPLGEPHSAAPPDPHYVAAGTSTLLATNLPTLLFSQTVDLHPLFCPFGEIKKLEILEPPQSHDQTKTISVLVQYASIASAEEAKEALQAQLYAGCAVHLEFMHSDAPTSENGSQNSLHSRALGSNQDLKSTLNPYATPFVLQTLPINASSSAYGIPNKQECQNFSSVPAFPRGLPRLADYPNRNRNAKPVQTHHMQSHFHMDPMSIPYFSGENVDYVKRPPLRGKWPHSLPNVHARSIHKASSYQVWNEYDMLRPLGSNLML